MHSQRRTRAGECTRRTGDVELRRQRERDRLAEAREASNGADENITARDPTDKRQSVEGSMSVSLPQSSQATAEVLWESQRRKGKGEGQNRHRHTRPPRPALVLIAKVLQRTTLGERLVVCIGREKAPEASGGAKCERSVADRDEVVGEFLRARSTRQPLQVR